MNYDVQSIVLKNLGEIVPRPWENNQRTREYAPVNSWQRSRHAPNYLITTENYIIKGSFMKKENWTTSSSKQSSRNF